jgi:3-dehydroquinate synthase
MSVLVSVPLGKRSYDIHIGPSLLRDSGRLIADASSGNTATLPVVTDENVAKLHYKSLAESLEASGFSPVPVIFPPGEQTKCFSQLENLLDRLLALEIERGWMIVAFGGGVIGDLTGFAAGVLKRGVAYTQIPTTLLAQVDSSVGGKTSINTAHGKNLVGVFHQPRLVVADISILQSLPPRERLSGYAEVAKYGLLGDASFFAWLEENAPRVLAGDEDAVTHTVAHSCKMKADIVVRDERESGDRALLNLAHTFAHALEAAFGYSSHLTHGEAVGLGCVLAFKLSSRLGYCTAEDAARVEKHFAMVGFKTHISQIGGQRPSAEELLSHMRHDKKARDSKITFVLAKGVGKAFVVSDIEEQVVRRILTED